MTRTNSTAWSQVLHYKETVDSIGGPLVLAVQLYKAWALTVSIVARHQLWTTAPEMAST